jgi:acyl-CoA synthetase (AMP-forming)/AMP-acid ligase II
MNVGDLVDRAAEQWGGRPALHDAAGTLNFADLRREVDRLASWMRASGLERRSGLGLVAGSGRRFLVGLFAGMKCGAVVFPMAPRMHEHELRDTIARGGIHFILEESGECYRLIRTPIDAALPVAPHIADAAVVRFTSGTTGAAKGVVLSHQTVMDRIVAVNRGLSLGPDDTVVWVLPMAYHFVASIILYVSCGAAIAVAGGLDAGSIIECANRNRATMLYASPMHIDLLASDRSELALSTLNQVISTTTGISGNTCRRFAARFGLEVRQAYGIIEVGLPILNRRHAAEQPEAIGEAIEGFRLEILDDDHGAVAPGVVGRLAIQGPGMFDGYLNPPLGRDEVLKDGWFLTGDLASMDALGVVTLAGRAKSVINVAGTKVFPEEVEQVLLEHPAVSACRVRGRAQRLVGEFVIADVQLRAGFDLRPADLSAWCRRRLSVHKVPRVIEFVDDIPLTAGGKVLRC